MIDEKPIKQLTPDGREVYSPDSLIDDTLEWGDDEDLLQLQKGE
jgi:hypothetical protein